jgi:hypothetical protein
MPAGFQALTDSGFIQVDTEIGMPNWQLRQKITLATNPSGQFQLYYNDVGTTQNVTAPMATFGFTALSPLVAFACDSGAYVCPLKWTQNGNSFVVDVVANANCNITAYIFDQADQTISGNNYGAQCFNALGRCVADVTVPFARFLGTQTNNLQFPNGATGWYASGGQEPPKGVFGSWGYGVGQVAIACVRPAYMISSAANGCWLSMFNTSGGTVTGNFGGLGSVGGDNNYVGFKEAVQWAFAAIDVTNY